MIRYFNTKNIRRACGMLALSGLFLHTDGMTAHTTEYVQEQNKQLIQVSFNTPFDYRLVESATWTIYDAQNQMVLNGVGSLTQETLSIPGLYRFVIQSGNSLGSNGAGISKEYQIQVSSTRMKFDFNSITFSKPILGEVSTKGTKLSITVDYESTDNLPVMYTKGFTTAGIQTSIKGELSNGPVSLIPGKNTLEFDLEGTTSKGNFLMLDFFDLNDAVQTHGLTDKIQ